MSVCPAEQDSSRHQLEKASSKREAFVQECGASWQCWPDMQQIPGRLNRGRRTNSCVRKAGTQGNRDKLETVKIGMIKWLDPRERAH